MFTAIFGSIGSIFKSMHLTTLHAEAYLGESLAETHKKLKATRIKSEVTAEDVKANLDFINTMCGYKQD